MDAAACMSTSTIVEFQALEDPLYHEEKEEERDVDGNDDDNDEGKIRH
jgi:hypothetical protein